MRSIRDFIAKNERDFDTLPPTSEAEPVGIMAEDLEVQLDGEPVVEASTIQPIEKRALSNFFSQQKGSEALKKADDDVKQIISGIGSEEVPLEDIEIDEDLEV